MSELTPERILSYLRSAQDEMADLLRRLAQIESPSRSAQSQQAVFAVLEQELHRRGFRLRRIGGKRSGGQMLAVPETYRRNVPKQLLLGHCDTVWPCGTLASMPVRMEQGRLHGPGVYDMKGGLVQGLFALDAIRQGGDRPTVQPIFFINSDEEIGSSESAANITRLARIVDRAFVLEPSLGPEGRLKTARKGVGRFTIDVEGVSAHAGLDPEKGVSAVLELSYLIQTLFGWCDAERGVSINVGRIEGGTQANVIAAEAHAEIDVRVPTAADARRVEQAFARLTPTLKGVRLQVRGGISRPPLEPTPRNRALWSLAQRAASSLGLDLAEGTAGGGSDGNWTSLHTATLDGLGAVGDGAHATHEHVIVEQMPERAALLACLLREPPLAMAGA